MIVLVWVDDLVSFTNRAAESNCIEEELKLKFKIQTVGKPLGLCTITIFMDDSPHMSATNTIPLAW